MFKFLMMFILKSRIINDIHALCSLHSAQFPHNNSMSPRHLLPLFTLSAYLVSSEILLESGYSITTVLDFNKPLPSGGLDVSGIHPFALHPLTRSANLLILLDSINSTFYSLDLPLSQGWSDLLIHAFLFFSYLLYIVRVRVGAIAFSLLILC